MRRRRASTPAGWWRSTRSTPQNSRFELDGKSSMAIRLLSRRTQSFIANEAKTAIDLIFDAAGGRCLQHGHPLQRAWRDVAAINHHISLNFDAVMSMYGQFVFGLPLEGQY